MSIDTTIVHCCQIRVEDPKIITETNPKGLRPCGNPVQTRSNAASLKIPGDPTATSLPTIIREKPYTKPKGLKTPIYVPDSKNRRCDIHQNAAIAAKGLLGGKAKQVQQHGLDVSKVDKQNLDTLCQAAEAVEAGLLPGNDALSAEEQRAYQDYTESETRNSDHGASSPEKTPYDTADTCECGVCGGTVRRGNLARHKRLHCNRKLDGSERLAKHLRTHESIQQQLEVPSTRPDSPTRLQQEAFESSNRLDLKTLIQATADLEAEIESVDDGLTAQPQTTFHQQRTPHHNTSKVTKARSPAPYHRSHNPADRRTCGLCKKTVHQKALREHMRTHSGEKKYGCPVCSYASCHGQDLKRHVRKHHPDQA